MRLKTRIDLSYKDNHMLYCIVPSKISSFTRYAIVIMFRKALYQLLKDIRSL